MTTAKALTSYLWTNPVFKKGDTVACLYNYAYENQLTRGKAYKVLDYIPREVTPGFTFPAYVAVMGDNGKKTECHATRMIS